MSDDAIIIRRDDEWYHCPKCNERFKSINFPNYCPNCGKKIIGLKNGDATWYYEQFDKGSQKYMVISEHLKGERLGARWKHFITICKHKAIVYRECKACGIWWQGVVHDLSKFSPVEFASSARYFQGDKSPIEAEKAKLGYSVAWLNHKGHNKHHWEWWTDFADDGSVIANKIPPKYVIEMVCDWIGAGMVYSGEKWTQAEPLNYYNKVRAGRHFHTETEKLIITLLEIIKDKGLDEFHKVCKNYLQTND